MHEHRCLARMLASALIFFGLAYPAAAQIPATINVGKPFIAAGTDVTKSSNGWALTSHGISQNLFIVDKQGLVAPWLATGVERAGDKAWVVRLKPGVRFSDGSPMTAAEVAACLLRSNELNGNARASTGRISVTVIDALTLRIDSERAVPNMGSVLAEWPLAIYKPAGAEDFVFTGPYMVAGMKSGSEFSLVPNPHYPGADKRPPIRIRLFPETQSMALALQSGELDLAFGIPAESLPRIAAQPGFATRTITGGYMYLMIMNHARPPLDDPRLRQAIDLAVDRAMLVKAAKAGQPAQGLYAAHYPFSAKQAYRHDPKAAAALLDEAGWKPGAGGLRAKDGKRLAVTLYATSNWPDLMIYLPVIRQQLAAIGIETTPRVVEQFLPIANSGDFDLLFRVTHTAPAGDPAFFANDGLRGTGTRNFGRYKSAELDAVLTRMEGESDARQRVASALELQRIVARDLPVAPIAEVPFHIGLSKRLAHYDIWGTDYYIIRDDLVAR
ncbi:MAG: peptide-binding protein [Alphaproteobacteria bacterium]|nr:peptide-binding protein [Alphaproteobacteria bacterium]